MPLLVEVISESPEPTTLEVVNALIVISIGIMFIAFMIIFFYDIVIAWKDIIKRSN